MIDVFDLFNGIYCFRGMIQASRNSIVDFLLPIMILAY
jgi:hypothetical protein